jgi:prepilin-type N-terminal cleavage/methylation domain-containing protein
MERVRTVLRRLRSDEGFGLIEVMIALTILSVGIFALIATYSSGSAALLRASRTATAGVVADTQMELYRGLTYAEIGLDSSTIPTAPPYAQLGGGTPYTGGAQVTLACSPACSTTPPCSTTSGACAASRPVTGPDGRNYRVDVYIYPRIVAGSRPTKLVGVVVRDALDSKILARQVSTFDLYAGCVGTACSA